jgi:hypothetical protein
VKVVSINQPDSVGCKYSPSDTKELESHGDLILVIFPHVTVNSWMQAVAIYTHQIGGQSVSNLGDAAREGRFSAPSGNTTYVAVLDGSLAFVVERVTFATPAVSATSVVSLARSVLGRL